ncbi:zinc-dependent alcohol dehydrogenase family protein [Bifidobacterium avesanii]|uniref:Alcohol dehydrogenase catalytic domain-containing protein n=1 Tax=Bifidobacterium avesanii TaxID=1798157 RepID=A0A7K3TG17_9BIFI|nr:zinc-dependent alcohol dehydrogenase family protein [Bifidobacterium avesanii]KAB8291505.1 IMP dehydrogenase [Bifidobacterium avesanii]NEG77866.1 alcohol dehydrogenase catalytic domain-containing protein [Bifidobacterium avesanii]
MSEMMKAAMFMEPGRMAVEEVPKARVEQPTDVMIRVVRTCVCGSDLWYFRGLSGHKEHSQIGHEAIGVIEEAGDAVADFHVGDFVVVPFPYSCGKCPVCEAGFESCCPHGGYFGANQAEYVRVPEADGTLVKVPGSPEDYDDATLASLLTISDVMSTGYHAAVSAEVKPGDTAVVMGDGAVGLCGVIGAKLLGAKRIIAMSRHEDRAALAREFGATDVVAERDQAAIDKVLAMTGGYGADAVLECVGSKQSFDTAVGLARAGAVIGRVGLPHDVTISAEGSFYHNLGIKGGPAPVRHYDLGGLLDAVLNHEINPGRVFTAEYDLDHIQDAYEAMDQRKVIKSLIRF